MSGNNLHRTIGEAVDLNDCAGGLLECNRGIFIRLVDNLEFHISIDIVQIMGQLIHICGIVVCYGCLVARNVLNIQGNGRAFFNILDAGYVVSVEGHTTIAGRCAGYIDVNGITMINTDNKFFTGYLVLITVIKSIDIVYLAIPDGCRLAIRPHKTRITNVIGIIASVGGNIGSFRLCVMAVGIGMYLRVDSIVKINCRIIR